MIAVCGLNCGKCDIFLAPNNPKIAEELVIGFNGMWESVKPSDFHCSTCRGSRVNCWTEECRIRECCFDKKNLNYCFEDNKDFVAQVRFDEKKDNISVISISITKQFRNKGLGKIIMKKALELGSVPYAKGKLWGNSLYEVLKDTTYWAVLKHLKAFFDPHNIMNPGALGLQGSR